MRRFASFECLAGDRNDIVLWDGARERHKLGSVNMGQVSRRGLLVGLGAGLATGAFAEQASATIVRSLSLPALVKGSRRIVVVTALASESHVEELGRRRRIVTDTRVRVEETVAKSQGIASELMVRTLGGAMGGVGE